MSFKINTNVAAIGAMRNIGMTNTEFSKSINKLSTGLRISTAADDPAGLVASEQFRAQITGLDQAVRNSQDAINFAKTAEGALNEVNTLLKDARTLAVASGNTATLTSAQSQANQAQLKSIVESITRISSTTQYGSKKLLDGTSGTSAAVTDGTNIGSINIGGTVGGAAATTGTVTLNSLTAATQGTINSKGFAALTTTTNAGSFTLNGVTFNSSSSTTAGDLLNMVNQASQQTGVSASYDGTQIVLKSNEFGSGGKVNLTDANAVLRATAGSTSAAGTDATASLDIAGTTVAFTGSLNGNGGLTLADADGNTVTLNQVGNTTTTTASAIGQVTVGSPQFQIGANSGQTASLSIGNFAASNIGSGVVAGKTLANLDLMTASGASDALKVIDKAIEDVTKARGSIGNFQRNVLESNVRSLNIAKENLTATESSIRDVDVADEMTKYTKLQILQQAGMSVLSQANQAPNAVMSLLRG
ncbi:MAG: flagellin [Fimbriimonas sp.]